MKPRWMRRHFSCPECGQAYGVDGDANPKYLMDLHRAMPHDPFDANKHPDGFNCLVCNAHFSYEDFKRENEEKWDHHMAEPDFKELSKEEFIQRLVQAGWSCEQATVEWQEIQNDKEGTP